MAKETAEQRLLKLIEESGGGAAQPAEAAPAAPAAEAQKALASVSGSGVATIAIPPFLQKILSLFSRSSSPSSAAEFGLKQINQLLIGAVALMALFVFMDFKSGLKAADKDMIVTIKQKTGFGEDFIPVVKSLSDYLSVVSERNIFRPFEKKEEVVIAAPVENMMIKDRVADFKIVGISWLNTPDTATVMIEDTKTSITHFLKTGDSLNGVKVDTIYADRIIVSYQGESLPMNL